jgi:hypothetical protein
MNDKDAIAFLKKYQPLPDDGEELEAIIKDFDEVRLFFLENPNPECIPLFLNCFGNGSGYGIYQLVEDVIFKHDQLAIIHHLNKALYSNYESVRYWCAQIAEQLDSEDLLDGLINVYEKGNDDAKCASLTALSGIHHEKVIELAKKVLKEEKDEVLLEIADDIVNDQ